MIPAQAIALDPRADNTRVDRITLNRAATGGYDRDARLGDAGVTALVEPRDARGELAPAAGPVSVVILDGGRSGKAARVARWDFTTEQVASLYRKSPYGEGIYLEMPWPGSPPERSHLQMFVRYTTQDGRNLEASQELDVAVPRYRQKSWTPLAPSAAGPAPVETARMWQPKPFRAEDPTVQPAVAEEPVVESIAQATPKAGHVRAASFAEKFDSTDAVRSSSASPSPSRSSADKVAVTAEPASGAPERDARLQRPVWSPLR